MTELSNQKRVLKYQKNEINAYYSYRALAERIKDPANSKIIRGISNDEMKHYEVWRSYTKQDVKPSSFVLFFFKIISIIMGYTFAIKLMERGEDDGLEEYLAEPDSYPEIYRIIQDEKRHEQELIGILDEERLQYVGAMILGLNDALVELTGTIAGLTFAMMNNRLVAMSAIITGIAATLSMAASNYLAEKADGSDNPLKSSLFTGGTYLLAVVLLVLPYLLYPSSMYVAAFITMLVIVLLLIAVFNYYISVAKSQPFLKPFGQMAAISFGVMIISYLIGLLAKALLHIDVM